MNSRSKIKSNKNFHKGFYLYGNENITYKLLGIKSSFPAEIRSYNDKIYYQADVFLHGICHVFAYTLHQRFGYDILEIENESGTTTHWCCLSKYRGKDLYIDVRGMTTDFNEVLWDFRPNIDNHPVKRIIEDLSPYEDEWEDDTIKFANELIDKYFDYYSL